ncbi:hypothetical protein JKF63_04929 [Porcisia hertigi]|uniref:Uncharacterized protein n=1 Tax=Porcisia hertigi TaxID=2761500 RepID=A0A836HRE8_9TRYP|nr:hypothetical protein JKF63_04929 [Porcisia hertigi]
MDWFNFASSQRYRSRLPLRQLQFTVTVYRAIVVEEDKAELLVEKTVQWDGKVLSPAETLNLYHDLTQLLQRSTTEPPPNSDKVRDHSHTAALHLDGVPSASSHVGMPASAPGVLLPNMPCFPALPDIVAQRQKVQFSVFTRPSEEDFINRAEEDVPVDPPPGPSLLAPIILRQHRRDHQPNRRMFLMWAAGELLVRNHPPGGTSRVPLEAASVTGGGGVDGVSPTAASPRTGLATGAASSPLAATSTEVGAAGASITMDNVSWVGDERVLCTLTADEDEHFFTAKPSLNELHTLVVDAAYIYTFRVTVSRANVPAARQGRVVGDGMLRGVLPGGRFSSSSIAPLEVLLSNIRHVARSVEEQYESLEVSNDAVARRLLRQVAMMVPPERGSADAGASPTAAAAAAAASSASEGTEMHRGRETSVVGISRSSAARCTDAGSFAGYSASISRPRRQTSSGVALPSRTSVIHGASSLPCGCCHYYVFGTVDRCVGIPESTLFVRCQLVEDRAPTTHNSVSASSLSSPGVYEFNSQLVYASTFVESECLLDIDHVFNLPFDYSFLGAAAPSSPLRLIATAFTEGAAAEGLQAPVAYACVTLPIASPGHHKVTAPMWAPHKTGIEFLRSALLGGAPGLVDARQAGPASAHRTGLNVKEGLYTDSVGTLHITLNILHRKYREKLRSM